MMYQGNKRYEWCSTAYESPVNSGLEQPCLNRAVARCYFCQELLCERCLETCSVCDADFCAHCLSEHVEDQACPSVFADRILAFLNIVNSPKFKSLEECHER